MTIRGEILCLKIALQRNTSVNHVDWHTVRTLRDNSSKSLAFSHDENVGNFKILKLVKNL